MSFIDVLAVIGFVLAAINTVMLIYLLEDK